MAEIIIKSGIKNLDFKNAEGQIVVSYPVNVGQKEQTKKWIREIQKVKEVSADLTDNETILDELEVLEKGIVVSVLGEGAWTTLWGACDSNVFSMLSIIGGLSKFLKESMEDFYKDYV